MNAAVAPVVLYSCAEAVADAVCASAAALGVPCEVVTRADAALARWSTARVVLVGADVAATVASVAPRRRAGVYLVGFDADELSRWSMPLGAEVVPLPHGLSWLGGVLGEDTAGVLLGVVGGAGGVGASTLAAGLALEASRRGCPAALVDLDPVGGGVDLLLGAERTPGWRWPRLVGARGELSDIRDVLPAAGGVTVVSTARGDAERAGPEAVAAVVRGLLRHHGLVVLDAGRGLAGGVRAQLRQAHTTLLVVPAEVRGVAAAAQLLDVLEPEQPSVVVRRRPAAALAPVLVADAVGLDLAGVLPHDPQVARRGAWGDVPPGRRSRWGRAVGIVLDRVLGGDDGR